MKKDFNNTINILVKAYLNGTLKHGNYSACAVGNIISHSLPYSEMNYLQGWPTVFMTELDKLNDSIQTTCPENYFGEARKQIDSTGYTWRQLAKIEKAFESVDKSLSSDDRMFFGLMAVIDVLAKIHKIDFDSKQKAKILFHK